MRGLVRGKWRLNELRHERSDCVWEKLTGADMCVTPIVGAHDETRRVGAHYRNWYPALGVRYLDSINSILYPSGSCTNAITVVPPFTGPGSRVTAPPAVRACWQAAATSGTPIAT